MQPKLLAFKHILNCVTYYIFQLAFILLKQFSVFCRIRSSSIRQIENEADLSLQPVKTEVKDLIKTRNGARKNKQDEHNSTPSCLARAVSANSKASGLFLKL